MPRPTPRTLARQLAQLHAGERAWFWLCPAAPAPTPPLLLRPLGADPDAADLRAHAEGLSGGQPASVGIASVDGLGLLTLCGPDLSYEALWALARWCRAHHAEEPALLRLRDLTMVRTDRAGQVCGQLAAPGLWEGLPPRNPDLSAHLQDELDALPPEDPRWFWLSEASAGSPVLVLGDPLDDPDGAAFAEEVRAFRRGGHFGTLRRTPAGLLAFSSPAPVAPLAAVVSRLCDDLGLPGAMIFQTDDTTIIDARHIQGTT